MSGNAAAQEAVARAKAIAARLVNNNNNNNNNGGTRDESAPAPAPAPTPSENESNSGNKRKRWGVTPSSKDNGNNNNVSALPGLDDVQKRLKTAGAAQQKRVWVSTRNKPPSHFRLFWQKQPLSLPDAVSVRLHGRGSSNQPPLPGVPEEPLHVLLEGPTLEMLDPFVGRVEDYLARAEQAELLVDENETNTNDNNNKDDNNNKNDSGSSLSGHSSFYRPAPVAALIHPNMAGGAFSGEDLMEEQIGVPNGVVGYIIGRGGESIASMQARTGCKVQIQKEHDMTPGQTQRVITLQATTKEAIDACRSIIENMVQERIRTTNSNHVYHSGGGASGQPNQDAKLQEAIAAGHVLVSVEVPDTDVGLIIGKSGATIKGIQDRSGANIQIPQNGDADNPSVRTVSITHPHSEGANLAKQLIQDILGSKRNQVPHITLQVEIPDKDVGMCIGRSGCVIREMQNQTQTKIQIPSFSTPGQTTRIATVVGPSEGCHQVKQMIERIILEQSSQSVMSGGYDHPHGGGGAYGGAYGGGGGAYGAGGGGGGAYGGSHGSYGAYGNADQSNAYGNHNASGYYGGQQQQGGGGQRDYSAEWAAYYAATETSQGDPAAQKPSSAAPSAAAPAPDTYYEQFFRYSYYYGEDAARKYYGAWSPAVGTPNPYGANPNGITPAPAPASSPAAPDTSVRDTGRRGVSNLPAWMTQGKTE